jgi:sugar lactone lactonase YvrE
VAVDASGNIYIADTNNQRIRKVTVSTGKITTVAGGGTGGDGGAATSAGLDFPYGVAVDASGNIYIADYYHQRIRKVTVSTGKISTVAGNGTIGYSGDGGVATSAELANPYGVAVDASGNIYIADMGNAVIRKVTASTGIITTVAGNGTAGYSGDGGPATSADLDYPPGVAVDSSGNIYIVDATHCFIRKVTASDGIIATVAGDGTGGYSGDGGAATSASIGSMGVAVDTSGNIYIADYNNSRIRAVGASKMVFQTISFTAPTTPVTYGPAPITLSATASSGLAVTFSVTSGPATVNGSTLTITGLGTVVIAANQVGNANYAAAATVSKTIVVNGASQAISFPALTTPISYTTTPITLSATANSGLPVTFSVTSGPATVSGSTLTITGVGTVVVAANQAGNTTYAAAATVSQTIVVNKVTPTITWATPASIPYGTPLSASLLPIPAGDITTVAGDATAGYAGDGGAATSAELAYPSGVAVDASGNIYIADYVNQRIRKVTASTGVISTVAGYGTYGYSGDGGAATSAKLDDPMDVAVDSSGNIYIADSGNLRIRKVAASTGIISTVAGNGTGGYAGDGGAATSAKLDEPMGVSVDASGNIYIADTENSRIRKVTVSTGKITTVAGNGTAGYAGDGGAATSAKLAYPSGVAVDSFGNIYIADRGNDLIRKVTASTGIITTVAGLGTGCSQQTNSFGDGCPASSVELGDAFGVALDTSPQNGSCAVTFGYCAGTTAESVAYSHPKRKVWRLQVAMREP